MSFEDLVGEKPKKKKIVRESQEVSEVPTVSHREVQPQPVQPVSRPTTISTSEFHGLQSTVAQLQQELGTVKSQTIPDEKFELFLKAHKAVRKRYNMQELKRLTGFSSSAEAIEVMLDLFTKYVRRT